MLRNCPCRISAGGRSYLEQFHSDIKCGLWWFSTQKYLLSTKPWKEQFENHSWSGAAYSGPIHRKNMSKAPSSQNCIIYIKKPDTHLPCNNLLSYDYLNASGRHAAISVMSLREGGPWKVRERRCLVLRPEHEILPVIVFLGNEAKLCSWKPPGCYRRWLSLVVSSTCCSSIELEFSSQHPHWMAPNWL